MLLLFSPVPRAAARSEDSDDDTDEEDVEEEVDEEEELELLSVRNSLSGVDI